MKNRRVEIFDSHGIFDTGKRIGFVFYQFVGRLSVHVTATQWATEDRCAKSVGPMIASVSDVDFGGATEFSPANDDRRV
jgi:hypothetical protein